MAVVISTDGCWLLHLAGNYLQVYIFLDLILSAKLLDPILLSARKCSTKVCEN